MKRVCFAPNLPAILEGQHEWSVWTRIIGRGNLARFCIQCKKLEWQ